MDVGWGGSSPPSGAAAGASVEKVCRMTEYTPTCSEKDRATGAATLRRCRIVARSRWVPTCCIMTMLINVCILCGLGVEVLFRCHQLKNLVSMSLWFRRLPPVVQTVSLARELFRCCPQRAGDR